MNKSISQDRNQSEKMDSILTLFNNVKWKPSAEPAPSFDKINMGADSIASKVQQVKSITAYISYAEQEYAEFSKLGVNVRFKHDPVELENLKSSLLKSIDKDDFDNERNVIASSLIESMSQRISFIGGVDNIRTKKYLKEQFVSAQKGELAVSDFKNIVSLAKSDPNNLLDEMKLSDSYLDALGEESYLDIARQRTSLEKECVNLDEVKPENQLSLMDRLREKVNSAGDYITSKAISLYERISEKEDVSNDVKLSTTKQLEAHDDFETLSDGTLERDIKTQRDDLAVHDEKSITEIETEEELELSLQPRMTYHV